MFWILVLGSFNVVWLAVLIYLLAYLLCHSSKQGRTLWTVRDVINSTVLTHKDFFSLTKLVNFDRISSAMFTVLLLSQKGFLNARCLPDSKAAGLHQCMVPSWYVMTVTTTMQNRCRT